MAARRAVAWLLAGLVLAGCAGTGEEGALASTQGDAARAGGGGFLSRPFRKPPLARADLVGGAVVVAGPEGYCVDPKTVKRQRDSGFAMLASCNILSGGRGGAYVEPVIVTIVVGAPGTGDALPAPEDLAGNADAALLRGDRSGDLVMAHLATGGEEVLSEGDPRYWRGVFALGDRLVSLALYAPRGADLAGASGGRMLTRVKGRIVALSPAPGDAPVEKQAQASSGGVFARLFNQKNLP
ncbi:dihydroxy-acid dehydratase [Aestuariicoccus sp. MJ-SS9]|uniref:dihydroxy-acid dehydratase n=1 Tax=Aestuariicoccus sp. MJ-SS9 TaxID=3079855 RepID=UPI00290EF56E|nr:dihydroxy-acid dehydratase [Aestuariicoccus sp. MJ-SS9]MDU8910717.1 dihydroxy-acid dehydratase [Aestuariicoccus sp. MJ-SS9]